MSDSDRIGILWRGEFVGALEDSKHETIVGPASKTRGRWVVGATTAARDFEQALRESGYPGHLPVTIEGDLADTHATFSLGMHGEAWLMIFHSLPDIRDYFSEE